MSRPARRPARVRLVALAAALQLVASLCAAAALQPAANPPAPVARSRPAAVRSATTATTATSATSATAATAEARLGTGDRAAAVRALLDRRAVAVRAHDRAAFLATVDPADTPGATAFRARQARVLDALRDVPLSLWTYHVDPAKAQPGDPELDRRYGTWWAPDVVLRYALAGFDAVPTERTQGLTFVRRAGRWYLAADDDFVGRRTARELWDGGPVVVVRGAATLVLAHPGSDAVVRLVLRETDAAVPRVTAVWGADWAQKVVLVVPDSSAELRELLPDVGALAQIAALATAELSAPGSGYHPVGDRILINPPTFARLGPLGRRVVLTHEVTHVASRAATGPDAPTWLVEGLADYVGYGSLHLPLSSSATELQSDVRGGRLPTRLPLDAAFDGTDPDLAQVYEQSWLAVVLLARTYGEPALLRLYRAVGSGRSFGQALQDVLRTTQSAFTLAWRDELRRELA